MSRDNTKKSPTKKPFKYTRELVRMALNDGWTQKQIAEKCRTQQSIVSGWKNGSKRGTEQQLKPLLDIYGYKLRRQTFRVYWSRDIESGKATFWRVEGKVILTHTVYIKERSVLPNRQKKEPSHRYVVHHQGDNQFVIVSQKKTTFKYGSSGYKQYLQCDDEEAVWASDIVGPMDKDALLIWLDDVSSADFPDYPDDMISLTFRIRKALLQHGFQIDGIEERPALC